MKPFDFGKISLDVTAGGEPAGTPDSSAPFRIAILGDFSGRASRGLCQATGRLSGRHPLAIDRDNLDQVMARLSPVIRIGAGVTLCFRELDEFHPDRIYGRVDAFPRLRAQIEDLAQRRRPEPAPAPDLSALASGNLLDNVLEATEQRTAGARSADPLARYVRALVEQYATAGPDPHKKDVASEIDAALGGLMRGILHYADFQALEAAWRGLDFLVRRLDTDEQLKLLLIDVSKAELAADLGGALEQSGLWRLLVEEAAGTHGGERWALIAGNYTFEQTRADAELLGRMAKIAARAGAPFIAEAGAQGAEEEGEKAWEALRGLPDARWIGLALPRFLLRLPYGRDTDPIESFPFAEMPGAPVHSSYLWGNPAFACVSLLGRAFSNWGWDMRPGMLQDIEGLPSHFYKEDGETKMTPCAEMLMTVEAAEQLLDLGLMPLASMKNQDRARLVRFQSIALPLRPLAGRWG